MLALIRVLLLVSFRRLLMPLLSLTIFHGIFFHPHEGCLIICLGKAVTIPTDVQLLCVVLQTADVRVQCLHGTLKHGLSFSTPVNEDDVLFSLDAFPLLTFMRIMRII